MIFAVVDFHFPHSALPVLFCFPCMSSLLFFPFSPPSNGAVVEIRTCVQSEERSCLPHSLSLGVRLRGLVCV